LQVFDWPVDGRLLVPGLKNKIAKAYLLADRHHQRLLAANGDDGVVVTVPPAAPDKYSSTVVLEIKGEIE